MGEEEGPQADVTTPMKLIMADVGKLPESTHELRFFRPDFQAGAYERTLFLEVRIFRVISMLRVLAASASEKLSDVAMPLSVVESIGRVNSFADAVQETMQGAAELWTDRMDQLHSCSALCLPADIAHTSAVPFVNRASFEDAGELVMSDRRNHLIEILEGKPPSLPPYTASALASVRCLCKTLTQMLIELDLTLKDIVQVDAAELYLH